MLELMDIFYYRLSLGPYEIRIEFTSKSKLYNRRNMSSASFSPIL